ncbi:flavin containing amine oxidase protein [Rutstroemia sp. NJR-2017a WRK4]|nr:flavin containing amine oxidase protein [Rutstroemia sp. NJR-2017a WRK4]
MDPVVHVKTNNGDFYFDEIVVTLPLGCLQRHTVEFSPSLPYELNQAIKNVSYSSLEKIFIAFPTAFWHESSQSGMELPDKDEKVVHLPHFVHYLRSLDDNRRPWTIEMNPLSFNPASDDSTKAIVLITTYGACASHLASLLQDLKQNTPEYVQAVGEFFRPYYSLLPNYQSESLDCRPVAAIATNWKNDPLTGFGSYTNFQISKAGSSEDRMSIDNDIRTMRLGTPERGIWFAGEHTAPFVAVGTTSGAYWSGEMAGVKVLRENGLLRQVNWEKQAVI